MAKPFITAEEMAERLKIPIETLNAWLDSGVLEPAAEQDGQPLFDPLDAEEQLLDVALTRYVTTDPFSHPLPKRKVS